MQYIHNKTREYHERGRVYFLPERSESLIVWDDGRDEIMVGADIPALREHFKSGDPAVSIGVYMGSTGRDIGGSYWLFTKITNIKINE